MVHTWGQRIRIYHRYKDFQQVCKALPVQSQVFFHQLIVIDLQPFQVGSFKFISYPYPINVIPQLFMYFLKQFGDFMKSNLLD